MRDAIGGAWLMGLVLTFVVLFSSFLAFAVNYSKAFKVKNEIINIIERSEGYTTAAKNNEDINNLSATPKSTEGKIVVYLKNIGYDIAGDGNKVTCPKNIYGENATSGMISNGIKHHNYCIKKIEGEPIGTGTNKTTPVYYKVTSFVMIELPLVWQTFAIPVSGETKRIYHNYDNGLNDQ